MADSTTAQRRDIQGLRAIAVLLVVVDHLGARRLAGGYVGVDVFLVLSGFLITGLLLRELDRDGRVSLAGFYARRARRILPAATLVLVAVAAYAAARLAVVEVERVSSDIRWSAVFLANVHFSRLGTDYFAEGLPPSPVQHFWSLAVEEQFYLVWPLAVLALALLLRHRDADARRRAVGLAAAVIGTVSLVWSVLLTPDDATTAYFSSLTRAWELAAGALLAVAAARCTGLGERARTALAVGGVLAVGGAAVTFDAATPFPGYHALLPVLGTVALLAAGTRSPGDTARGPLERALGVRPMTVVGDLSYSLYLWHWPVIVLARDTTGPRPSPTEAIALAAISLALAAASYHLVENPVRRSRTLGAPVTRGLLLWPAALGLALLATSFAPRYADHQLSARSAQSPFAEAWVAPGSLPEKLRLSLRMADAAAPIPRPIEGFDDLVRGRTDLWQRDYPCNANHDQSTTRLCPVGDPDGVRTMAVFGDSHIGMWLPALDEIARRDGLRLVPFIKYGCTPYDVPLRTEGGTRGYRECDDFRAWAEREIADLEPAVVIVGSRGLQGNIALPADARPRAWGDGVRSTLARLARTAPRVVAVSDISDLPFDPAVCLTDPDATMATCTADASARVEQADALTAAAASATGVGYLDLTGLVCAEGRCPAVADQRSVYANSDHVSVAWARHVTPQVARLLARARPAPPPPR